MKIVEGFFSMESKFDVYFRNIKAIAKLKNLRKINLVSKYVL
jgi:hypothetical protein